MFSRSVEGTPDGQAAALENMRVDHRRLKIFVTEQILHGPDIVAAFEQVGSETMAEGVATDAFADVRLEGGAGDRFLEAAGAGMMPGGLPAARVEGGSAGGGGDRARPRIRRGGG